MALSADDVTLYVVNRGDEFQTCQRISMLTTDETFLGEFGSYGTQPGEFIWPSAIAIDSTSRIYVADQWIGRINRFDKNGEFLNHWGEKGNGPGQLLGPTGLAFDGEDILYVTDLLSNQVQKFTTDGSYIGSLTAKPDEKVHFSKPWGITLDATGRILVADWNNHRILIFDNRGDLIDMIDGTKGSPGFRYPSDVAIDSDGDIYISDWWNNQIVVFDNHGQYLTTFIGHAERLSSWAQQQMDASPDHRRGRLLVKDITEEWRFNRPTAITIDSRNRIMIAESQRMRIQIYRKERNWEDPQFNL